VPRVSQRPSGKRPPPTPSRGSSWSHYTSSDDALGAITARPSPRRKFPRERARLPREPLPGGGGGGRPRAAGGGRAPHPGGPPPPPPPFPISYACPYRTCWLGRPPPRLRRRVLRRRAAAEQARRAPRGAGRGTWLIARAAARLLEVREDEAPPRALRVRVQPGGGAIERQRRDPARARAGMSEGAGARRGRPRAPRRAHSGGLGAIDGGEGRAPLPLLRRLPGRPLRLHGCRLHAGRPSAPPPARRTPRSGECAAAAGGRGGTASSCRPRSHRPMASS
jgi:hypothetical protein